MIIIYYYLEMFFQEEKVKYFCEERHVFERIGNIL